MIMSAALSKSGFTNRATLLILNKVGLKTSHLVLVFLVTGAFLSMWVTNMGVAAILLPLATEILENSNRKALDSNFGKALMISIAWGCGIGGMGTPVGNGANVLAVGFLSKLADININFIDWMKYGVPAMMLLLPVSWFILIKTFPLEVEELHMSKKYIENKLYNLGPLKSKEKKILLIYIVTIFLWLTSPLIKILYGISLPIQGIAVFAAITIFLPYIEILEWREANEVVNWGAIVLIAGSLSLGEMLFKTGCAQWIAGTFLGGIGSFPTVIQLALLVTLVLIFKIGFASNTASGLVIIPIVIVLAQEIGLDVWLLTGPATFAISLAFITVPSSPTNIIPYAAGYFSIKDFAFSGIPMSIAGVVILITIFYFLV